MRGLPGGTRGDAVLVWHFIGWTPCRFGLGGSSSNPSDRVSSAAGRRSSGSVGPRSGDRFEQDHVLKPHDSAVGEIAAHAPASHGLAQSPVWTYWRRGLVDVS